MHILFLPSWYPETDSSFGGSFFREQAEAFVDAHDVGVIAMKTFPVYQAGQYRSGSGRELRSAHENGVRVIRTTRISPVPKLHRLNNALAIRDIKSAYHDYTERYGTPDVLHAHSMFDAGIWASALSRHTGVPFVVTEHRPSSIGRLRIPGWRGPGLRAAWDAKALVAVANGFAVELNKAYGQASGGRWQYVPGLLSPQFETIDIDRVDRDEFVFGHVSHLAPGKRVDLIIRSFARLVHEGVEARLRIVGGSPALQALEDLSRDVGVADRVTFTGPVLRENIVQEFLEMDAFVLPSVAEAFGTVLWEAMATGIPVISTRTWAGTNAVREGVNGHVVPIDDEAALAGAMRTVVDNADTYDPQVIRRICLEHCGKDEFVRQYLELYRS